MSECIHVWIEFQGGSTPHVGKGFRAQWKGLCKDHVYKGQSGSLDELGYHSFYFQCWYTIAPEAAKDVSILFESIGPYDVVDVYKGEHEQLSQTYLGPASEGSTFTSDTGIIHVAYVSKNRAIVPCRQCDGSCGLHTTASGSFSDGSGASDYCERTNCTWISLGSLQIELSS